MQMVRRFAGVVAACALVCMTMAGCSAEGKLASNSELSGGLWGIAIHSAAFKHMEAIPEKYTQDGMNLSPPLNWSKGPNLVKEWALIVEDADAKASDGRPIVHWMVYKIPASVTELPEGASRNLPYPQGKNYTGETGYAGPKPGGGKPHRYNFEIFALDTPQDWPPGATRATIRSRFEGHVLSKGVLVGLYPPPSK
jgi:Raf kinase inhibitor-like YbhB/YbcL family protein